jgi:CubicO group peptidase (beta-lactamase class C family)
MKKFFFVLGLTFSLLARVSEAAPEIKEEVDPSRTAQIGVENGLRPKVLIAGEEHSGTNISERMKYYNVPGVSIAVVNRGKTEWSHGYGRITNDPKAAAINEHTLFQAGSISKPITAFGALLLVQQGKVSLDDDVNRYLKRWKVPENELTKTEKVTLRRLLSHTAGTSVHGFQGYSTKTAIPAVIEILEGKKPAVNSDPVRVILKPGSEFKYSGGGTTIVQLLIEDVTGEPFDAWMQSNVLMPLGMSESTFAQPLPPSYAMHAAYGHHMNGILVEGKWHIYPEMAAAGLWTTPKDLAQFITYIQSALDGKISSPLNSSYVKEMLTRQKIGSKETDFGLGLLLENEGQDLSFGHGGGDEGFIARLSGYAYRGQGVVIMLNNDSGWPLMEEITNSVADVYHWPDFKPIEKKALSVNSSSLISYPGEYVHGEDRIEVSITDNKLFIAFKGSTSPLMLYRSADCLFFVQMEDLTIEFPNCSGKPDNLTLTDAKGIKTIYKRTE